MSNRLKKMSKAKARETKKKVQPKSAPKSTPKTKKAVKASKSLVQKNVKLTTVVLIVTYFLLDYMMVDQGEDLQKILTVIFTMLAPSTLYSHYVFDYHRDIPPLNGTDMPRFVKNKKKFAIIGWLSFTVLGVILLIAEPIVVPKFFPVLDGIYYESQILLMLFVAPIMEEICYRYLLYDRWLKKKCGWFWGFVISSLIFVITHPVTDMRAFVVYYVPTVLFYLVYSEFGLYGSIVMHMIYNMMAI